MKVNIFPIRSSLHNEDVLRPQREEMLENLRNLTGFEVELVPLDKLYSGDLALILIETGGSENIFLESLPKLKEPFYFLTYQNNNSLPASLEIMTYLKRNDKKGEILHGSYEFIANRLRILMDQNIYPDRLGVIGKPSDWLISSSVNEEKLKKIFNIDLVEIPIKELKQEINKHNEDLDPSMFKANFDYQELKKTYHIFLALINLIKKYNLKGFTIRCFDLLGDIKSTACLALSCLNNEGVIGGCEGDVPSLISMFLIRKLFSLPSFMFNPSRISYSKNTLVGAHCTIPLSMCESYRFMTHFESNLGIGIKGEVKKGDYLIFRISPDLDEFVLLDAKLKQNLDEPTLCRTQVELELKDKKGASYFLNKPLGNHHLLVDAKVKDRLREFLLSKGLKEVK